jgi:phage major head subunit gpT-like protein
MQITPASVRDLRVAISMLFANAKKGTMPVWSDFAARVASTTSSTSFPQHAALRRLRRWDGERKPVNGKAYDYRVTAEKFELTASIPLTEIEDDNIGSYNAMVEDMGMQSALWPDDLCFDALIAGETELAFDGKTFFANDHELKPGATIDNLFGSMPLTKDNVATIIAEMMSYVGEDGRSLRIRPDTLAVPPALEDTGLGIVGSNILAQVFGSNTAAAGVDNTMRGRLKLKVYPELAAAAGGSDSDYYIMDTSRSAKPIVMVVRKDPEMTFKGKPEDDNVFWDDEVTMGVRARGVAGYGPFWLAAKGKG